MREYRTIMSQSYIDKRVREKIGEMYELISSNISTIHNNTLASEGSFSKVIRYKTIVEFSYSYKNKKALNIWVHYADRVNERWVISLDSLAELENKNLAIDNVITRLENTWGF